MEIVVRFDVDELEEMTDEGIGQAVRSIAAEVLGHGVPASVLDCALD